jgi:mycofactocin precursor
MEDRTTDIMDRADRDETSDSVSGRSRDETSDSVSDEIAEETLVEEVSIDGMCGVY